MDMFMAPPLVMVTTNDDTTEAYADYAARKIMSVADSAPQPIRDQAHAFQGQIREVVLFYMRKAVSEEIRRLTGGTQHGDHIGHRD